MLFKTNEIQIPQPKLKGSGVETEGKSSLEIGFAKQELQNAIGTLSKEKTYCFATKGAWSAHHLLEYLIRQVGSCACILASWAFSEQAARTVQHLKEAGLIRELRCYLDNRIAVNAPKAKSILELQGEITFVTSHSKMILLKNEEWAISVVMSANFSANRRLENGVILTDEKAYSFYKKMFEQSIQEQ